MKKKLTDYPELMKQWHPTKNGNLDPSEILRGSDKKVWWQCQVANDHEWFATVKTRTSGSECPCCKGNKAVLSNCLATTHPELAKQWHPTKNDNLTPYDVTYGSRKKVWWINDLLETKCSAIGDRTKEKNIYFQEKTCLAITHPELAKQWHPTKNNNLTPYDVISGSRKKVWWTCDAFNHEWYCSLNKRKNGTGCPYCKGKKVDSFNCLATTHPELAKQWHPTKNNNLTPYDVTRGSNSSVWWQCNKDSHPNWKAQINRRTRKNGTGCPFCNKSKGEKEIVKFFENNNINYETEYTFKNSEIPNYRFDFYTNKGLIEYHGKQHYVPINFGSKEKNANILMFNKVLQSDFIKQKWCEKNKIPLLVIPYWEKDRINNILSDFLNDKILSISLPPKEIYQYESMRQNVFQQS